MWSEKRNGQYDVRARKLAENGTPASAGNLIAFSPASERLLQVVEDGSGGALVLWQNPDLTVRAQRVNGNAAPLWAPGGVDVAPGAAFNSPARMIADGAGGAIFAWTDQRTGTNLDVYAQRLDATGARMWGESGLGLCALPTQQAGDALASDGAGGAFFAWGDQRAGTNQVYAQRVNAAGAIQWAANGLLVASYDGFFTFASPVMAVPAPSGQAVILILEFAVNLMTFETIEILHAQKIDGTGAAMWGTEGATLSDAGATTLAWSMAEDGAGGAYVAWADTRNGPLDIFAQHVDATGTVDWVNDGSIVCDADGWQFLGGMTPIGGGDVAVVWWDQRAGQPDVYAQRLDETGAAVWIEDGRDITPVARGQFFAGVAPWRTASPERLYLAWTDNRDGATRYAYAERLDLNGIAQWASSGVTSAKVSLATAEAEPGRVRIAWQASEPVAATVYRRAEGGAWTALASVIADATGRIAYEDREVEAGAGYAYRLGIRGGGAEEFFGEVAVVVPAGDALAIEGARPQPSIGELVVAFTLPRAGAARIECHDAAGRRVRAADLSGLSAGRHLHRFEGPALAPGVYFLRLTHEGTRVTAKTVVLE